ncbi:enoyl-CoA hydratase/isomerase family protein [Novosphingobium cyanobacteriorum]|uniref:Enoyl-CoA hydratase/isomerase family protein n=1 Tax=Novosphingobium cyanobacteriorum TaxID=3024215 RepID=A0ABT6CLX6_9SPHN|nr:enoyl-CoA hydratase/isomerase family protein [Novosphingobium cyanobacteriorum]MDF8334914.1 enoyl-CoA hydratase/isomerase family protein [Novosphingobium cyanobacteriorum]
MADPLVLVEQQDGIATVTLSDPPKRNAFSKRMREELVEVFTTLNADPECRAIVLTGAGGTFCSGGDISEMEQRTQMVARARLVVVTDLARLLLTGAKPIVAAIEGAAMGAGLTMAAACDYVVTASDARLCFAFARVGLLPDTCAYWIVPRRVGLAKAQELFALARTFDAAEAHRIQLVNEVVEPGTALERARAVAREYAAMPPVTTAILRGVFAQGFTSLEAAAQFELVGQPLMQKTADHAEAVAAFRAKRKPEFKGD